MATKPRVLIFVLTLLAMALVLAASVAAILTDDGGAPATVTSLRGEKIERYGGNGLYQNDSINKAVTFRGFDWANLVVCLPLAGLGIYLYRRGRLRGQLLLAAIFMYLAWNYVLGVMGNAYNNLFLVWTALFAIGIWGVFIIGADVDIRALPGVLGTRFPVKAVAIYLITLALFLFVQYAAEIINALVTGNPPVSLQMYTTLELAALELAVMIPLHVVGGVLLWRKNAWGYFLAILLAFTACMTFISLSVGQALLVFSLQRGSLPDVLIPIVLSVIAAGVSLIILMQVKDGDTTRPAGDRGLNSVKGGA